MPYRAERFVCSTKTRCVGYGSVECAHHHREVRLHISVEEEIVACKHNAYVQQDSCGREQVERYTAFLEALKEAWTDLQTDAEHEQNKSEVLNKGHGVFGGGEANMAC